MERRIILTAGHHNHLMEKRANCCRDEGVRDDDRVPTMMILVFDVASSCIGCVPCRLPDRYKVLDWAQETGVVLVGYFATMRRGQSMSRYPFIVDRAIWRGF